MQDRFQLKYNFPPLAEFRGKVIIGNNVWIGDNVLILSGVKIGCGSVIGAGAVVTREIPPFSVAAGVPAKVVKKRFSQEMIDFLIELRWWDWPEDKILANADFFSVDLSQTDVESVSLLIC